jgi:aflatoxin B1 aldehyde reductase
MTLIEATYRWLRHGSALKGAFGDAVLVGASNLGHLRQNLAACAKEEPLPRGVQAAFDAAFTATRDGCFPYWRSYSADHPDRENLHPGASYEPVKTSK